MTREVVSVGVRVPRGLGAAGRVPQKDRGSTAHPQRTCTDALLQADPGWLRSYYGCRKRGSSVSAGWAALGSRTNRVWLQESRHVQQCMVRVSTQESHLRKQQARVSRELPLLRHQEPRILTPQGQRMVNSCSPVCSLGAKEGPTKADTSGLASPCTGRWPVLQRSHA